MEAIVFHVCCQIVWDAQVNLSAHYVMRQKSALFQTQSVNAKFKNINMFEMVSVGQGVYFVLCYWSVQVATPLPTGFFQVPIVNANPDIYEWEFCSHHVFFVEMDALLAQVQQNAPAAKVYGHYQTQFANVLQVTAKKEQDRQQVAYQLRRSQAVCSVPVRQPAHRATLLWI